MRLFLFALAAFSWTAAAQTGALDPTFGTDGRVTLPITPGETVSATPIVSTFPDGGVVVGSGTPTDAAVARLTPRGALVATFGTNGVARFRVGTAPNQVLAVVALADGRVLAAGAVLDDAGDVSTPFLARLTASGALDPSFATNGVVTLGAADGAAEAGFFDVQVLPDERLLLLGLRYDAQGDPILFTVRLTADGARDVSYGSNGVVQTNLAVAGAGLALIGSRTCVVGAGRTASQQIRPTVVCLTASGTPDPAYGTGGQVFIDLGLNAGSLAGGAVDAQGRLVVTGIAFDAGLTQIRTALVRLTPSGALDPTFGGDGMVEITPATGVVFLTDVAVRPDGRVVGVGATGTLSNGNLVEGGLYVTQRQENGASDPTFGTDGAVVFDGAGPEASLAADLAPDGGLIIVGAALDGSNQDLTRLFALRLAAPRSTTSALPPTLGGPTLRHAGAHPSHGRVRLAFTLDAPSSVQVDLVDALGRFVERLASDAFGPGTHTIEAPALLPPGLYLARAVGETWRATLPVIVLR